MNRPSRWFVAAGLAMAVGVVVALGPLASDAPDGLERVAASNGLETEVRPHDLGASPVAGYQAGPVDNEALGSGVAAVVGISVTFLVGLGLSAGMVSLSRRRGRGGEASRPSSGDRSSVVHAARERDGAPTRAT